MPKRKQETADSGRRQLTPLAATMTTAAISLALPALLAAAPNAVLDKVPLTPATEAQQQMLLAYTPTHSEQAAVNKYFALGYTYCDAKVLAAFWGEADPYAAKVRLGDKMLRWGAADAQSHVPAARAQALQKPESELPCTFIDGGYTYEDAVVLAKYWGRNEPWEAKLKIARLLIQGKDPALQTALKNAKASNTPPSDSSAYTPEHSERAAVDKYFAQGYTYCDAKVLAAFWGEATPYAAKVRLGDKMLRWGAADARSHVPEARAQALQKPDAELPCTFIDGGYSYEDAVLLAKYWGRNEPEAKLKIAHLLIEGKERAVQTALKKAKPGPGMTRGRKPETNISVPWKLGVEIELLAPPGRSRQDLAVAIATHTSGAQVRRIFHPQGEPSKVPGTPVFENLTLGFVIEDAQGNVLAQCVDDLTLQDDLDRQHPPQPGWYRIVSDDARLLRLIMRHADPAAPLQTVLNPIASLFGTRVEHGEGGMVRVTDEAGASIAIGAPLPGERERPCELITPPMESDHLDRLESLLALARSLDFGIPAEGAIHLHFDATPLCSAPAVANLVTLLGLHGETLKQRLGTNPRCRRLGAWPQELFELVTSPTFVHLAWEDAREQLAQLQLTKYCDFNLRNVVHTVRDKHTFEVRILPVWLHGQKIVEAAALFAAILQWACDGRRQRKPVPADFAALRKILPP